MFTFKKNKKGFPNVDDSKPHSTVDMHYATDEKTKCCVCSQPFKDGDTCGLIENDGKLDIAHDNCPKSTEGEQK